MFRRLCICLGFLASTLLTGAKIVVENVTVGQYVSGGSQDAALYYNDEPEGPQSLVLFNHGMMDGGANIRYYDGLLRSMAEADMVVLAQKSCPHVYCFDFYKDALRNLEYAKGRAADYPFSAVDFDSVGTVGHSMGGAAAVLLGRSSIAKPNCIRAVVGLHPATELTGTAPKEVQVPTFLATGTRDSICPALTVRLGYDMLASRTKIYANLVGANHHEPTTGPDRWRPYVNAFLRCHLRGDRGACDVVEGMCKGGLDFSECFVEGG